MKFVGTVPSEADDIAILGVGGIADATLTWTGDNLTAVSWADGSSATITYNGSDPDVATITQANGSVQTYTFAYSSGKVSSITRVDT